MQPDRPDDSADAARRRFLAACGKFAIATAPTVTLMLAADARRYQAAASGGAFVDRGGDGAAAVGTLAAQPPAPGVTRGAHGTTTFLGEW
ncbi:MAG: hypothetical protein L6R19_09900 [Alphaproteobacteria bacterium]|nr:hypothetical protein [Alphaproteobacteria bacterium]